MRYEKSNPPAPNPQPQLPIEPRNGSAKTLVVAAINLVEDEEVRAELRRFAEVAVSRDDLDAVAGLVAEALPKEESETSHRKTTLAERDSAFFRYLRGETLEEIAEDLGFHSSSLSLLVRGETRHEEWRERLSIRLRSVHAAAKKERRS